MSAVTLLLDAAAGGDRRAAADLLPIVYAELRRLAAVHLAAAKPGQTRQATALVHEAYLRVAGPAAARRGDRRRHFFTPAAAAMRRILVDQARHKQTLKAGGHRRRASLDDAGPLPAADGRSADDLPALDEAPRQLEAEDPVKARLVKLRYVVGTSLDETAQLLDRSPATAERDWVYARAWLYDKLDPG
jgi:RNA polymerase sigma factor (TIGR02999 family)